MPNITFKIEGEPSDVLAAYRELHEAQRRTAREAKEGGETATRASSGIIAGIEGQITRMASYAGILALAHKGVQLIGDEWENVRERARKALEVQIPATEAMNRAILNMPIDWNVKEMEKWRTQVADRTKMPVARIGDLLQAAATKGGLGKEPALASIEAMAGLEMAVGPGAFSPEAMAGVFDIAEVTKARTPEEAKRALGWTMQVQRAGGVQSFEQALKTVPQSLVAMGLAGFKPGESAELFAALAQTISDETGEQTATAMVKWAKEIGEIVPEEVRGRGLRASLEYVGTLSGEKQKEAFSAFGARGMGPLFIRALAKGDEETWAKMAGAEAAILEPLSEEAGGTLEQTLARMMEAQGAETLGAARAGERTAEKAKLALSPAEQRAAAYRKELAETLQASGAGRLEQWGAGIGFDVGLLAGQTPEEALIDMYERRVGGIGTAMRQLMRWMPLTGLAGRIFAQGEVPADQAAVLAERIAELKEVMERLVVATEGNTGATKGQGAVAMPAGE